MNTSVLLIDNHSANRLILAGAMAGYGYQVIESDSFDQADSMLRAGEIPQMIVIDLRYFTPYADALIRHVRQRLGRRDVRIIVIGGHSMEEQVAYQLGADVFLYRPVEVTALLDTARSCLPA